MKTTGTSKLVKGHLVSLAIPDGDQAGIRSGLRPWALMKLALYS